MNPVTDDQPKPSDVDEAADRLSRRPWPAVPLHRELQVSFEFFPTKTPEGLDRLVSTAKGLSGLGPTFASVTYGAGGSSQDRTLETLERLGRETDLTLAGHLTVVGATRAETHRMVDAYLERGVRHIVALRGDEPEGCVHPADGYQSAAELVAGIRDRVGDQVEISVAAYPETHPKARSADADLENLRAKVDAGADRILTQFFYDNNSFLQFLDRTREAGINVPISAGIMPVGSYTKIASFAQRCGTGIPAWMPELFDGLDDAPDIQQMVAANAAAEQCRALAEHGVRHFHFYTMNKAELTTATCRILGLRARPAAAKASGSRRTA